MTESRYKAELAALARESCDACQQDYPVEEMARCSHCDGIFCATCFHLELGVCWKRDCVYSAANQIREARDAALVVLEGSIRFPYKQIEVAVEILEWTAALRDGYGEVFKSGRMHPSHRASWELHVGPIPDGLFVLHRCDNRPCVNPGHLFLGTKGDNNRDTVSKGRHPRIGAASLGAFGDARAGQAFPLWGRTAEIEACPVCQATRCTNGEFRAWPIRHVGDVVIHLNNDHRWTREAIADWWDQHYSEKAVAQVRESAEVTA